MIHYLAEPCDAVPRLPADLVQTPLHAVLQVYRHPSLIHGLISAILVDPDPEVEFLDINLTKDSSRLLHAIHIRFCWRIFKKTILFFGLKHFKKSTKQEKLSIFMNSIL
jgi:hypothetical protein